MMRNVPPQFLQHVYPSPYFGIYGESFLMLLYTEFDILKIFYFY